MQDALAKDIREAEAPDTTTLDHLSAVWGALPMDLKRHILSFVRHPVAAIVPKNHRWVDYHGRRRYVAVHPVLEQFEDIFRLSKRLFDHGLKWELYTKCQRWDLLIDLYELDLTRTRRIPSKHNHAKCENGTMRSKGHADHHTPFE